MYDVAVDTMTETMIRPIAMMILLWVSKLHSSEFSIRSHNFTPRLYALWIYDSQWVCSTEIRKAIGYL